MSEILKIRTAPCLAATVMFLGLIASAVANAAPVPGDVPRHAAEALALAQKWRPDAMLIQVQARQSMDYALEFGFRSPSTANRFSATYANGRMTSQAQPPVSANDGGAIPLPFLDLPAALAQARRQGMSSTLKEASLDVENSGGHATLAWSPPGEHRSLSLCLHGQCRARRAAREQYGCGQRGQHVPCGRAARFSNPRGHALAGG